MLKKDLLYPSIDQLLEKIDSKFKLSVAVAKISVFLQKDNPTLEEQETITQALEKILNGDIDLHFQE